MHKVKGTGITRDEASTLKSPFDVATSSRSTESCQEENLMKCHLREIERYAQYVLSVNGYKSNHNKNSNRSSGGGKSRGGKQKSRKTSDDSSDAKFENIQSKIKEAFNILDADGTGFIDNRQFKTLVYALHRVPNKNQMDDMFETVQDDKSSENFEFEKFQKMMTRVLSTQRYNSSSRKELEAAFTLLDTEKKGYYTAEEWTAILSSSGEPFSSDEIAETLRITVDLDTEVFTYGPYIKNLAVDDSTY